MRGEEAEGEADAWLLDSLRLYNDLHVFELQGPTRVISWTGEKRVCVAGYDHQRRNEILQLCLPPRLCAKENQGLCPERDFKVECGGFSDWPVYSLKHVQETSLLVTSGPLSSSLQLWRMEQDETDVIKSIGTVSVAKGGGESWSKIATAPSQQDWILHGLRVSDIQVTEIESRKTVFTTASTHHDELATLDFLDQTTFLACSAKGQLFLADVRQPRCLLGAEKDPAVVSALEGGQWCAGIGHGPVGSLGNQPQIARVSSGGCIVLTDPRNPASPLKAAVGCAPATPSRLGSEFLCISFAPLLEDCLAISATFLPPSLRFPLSPQASMGPSTSTTLGAGARLHRKLSRSSFTAGTFSATRKEPTATPG